MTTHLTEDEIRQALFGPAPDAIPAPMASNPDPAEVYKTPKPATKRKAPKRFSSNLKVTLRVGNEFKGETQLFVHEADTLSTLQAELDAKKAACKRFRYVA
jgi:hypothetical protein